MDDAGERVDRLAVDEHVQLDHVRGAVAGVFVVHRAVAAGDAFERSLKSMRISFSGSTQVSMTRVSSRVSVLVTSPRFSRTSCIMSPMYSSGTMMKTLTIGSRISWMPCGSGKSVGLSISAPCRRSA